MNSKGINNKNSNNNSNSNNSNNKKNNNDAPNKLPLLPVRDMVVFPYMALPLYIGRESSILAVEKAFSTHRFIFLSTQVEKNEENPKSDSIYRTGTIAKIVKPIRRLSDGRVKIIAQGLCKAKVISFTNEDPFFEVEVAQIVESPVEKLSEETVSLIQSCKSLVEELLAYGKVLSAGILFDLDSVSNDPGKFSDHLAANLNLKIEDTQCILEEEDHTNRIRLVHKFLKSELDILKLQSTITGAPKEDLSKTQREQFLREQMRAIKGELNNRAQGGPNNQQGRLQEDVTGYKQRITDAKIPVEACEEVKKQLARLEKMHPDSSEASMIRNYLDWMCDLPWSVSTKDNLDLDQAEKVLDEDHYDLEKAKERVLEFLAVRTLKDNLKGPILCFAGPPGVGKTSLGKSIARAMGRKYYRIALGGLKDEAEVRGHRRTYVGAMPGKIIQALKAVGTNNPVVVLDEIDKLGSDFRGDPSAAMLEVLDPQQNRSFKDNFINTDFDLSNVLFIATANALNNIPHALRDRMEVIGIPGYTENDKLLISRRHLIDKQIENNGLTHDQIEFTDNGLKTLIVGYTKEAGLRTLDRQIGSVCRKIAKLVVQGEENKKIINTKAINDLMGPPDFIKEERIEDDYFGVATGLAWTQVGGEILYIESLAIPGKGQLKLTGQLGDVMKESVSAANSYIKAHADELGIDLKWFEDHDIHIHMPSGAIPKDGPSAGVTLATALVSLIKKQPVRMDIAMTGEVTLTGRVLPVGGIREKALAALNHGITNIIIPFQNRKDIKDIPQEFKNKLNFIMVRNINEVLSEAFTTKLENFQDESNTEEEKLSA